MSVELTEKAAQHVSAKMKDNESALGLRVGTRKSGCTGYAYVVEFADQISPLDEVFESHGVKLIVDKDSLSFLDGMKIDYVKANAINEGFEFINPNVKDMCGCGESFNV